MSVLIEGCKKTLIAPAF